MPLTPTQLLVPRVLAIGTNQGEFIWPDSHYQSGMILTDVDGWYTLIGYPLVRPIKCEVAHEFQNLFRPLEWWEMREPGQMPEYVKQLDMIHPSKNWELVNGRWRFEYGPFGRQFIDGKMQPATNEQYIRYVDAIRGFPNS